MNVSSFNGIHLTNVLQSSRSTIIFAFSDDENKVGTRTYKRIHNKPMHLRMFYNYNKIIFKLDTEID